MQRIKYGQRHRFFIDFENVLRDLFFDFFFLDYSLEKNSETVLFIVGSSKTNLFFKILFQMFDIEKKNVLIVPRIIPNILSLNHDDLSRETEKHLGKGVLRENLRRGPYAVVDERHF